MTTATRSNYGIDIECVDTSSDWMHWYHGTAPDIGRFLIALQRPQDFRTQKTDVWRSGECLHIDGEYAPLRLPAVCQSSADAAVADAAIAANDLHETALRLIGKPGKNPGTVSGCLIVSIEASRNCVAQVASAYSSWIGAESRAMLAARHLVSMAADVLSLSQHRYVSRADARALRHVAEHAQVKALAILQTFPDGNPQTANDRRFTSAALSGLAESRMAKQRAQADTRQTLAEMTVDARLLASEAQTFRAEFAYNSDILSLIDSVSCYAQLGFALFQRGAADGSGIIELRLAHHAVMAANHYIRLMRRCNHYPYGGNAADALRLSVRVAERINDKARAILAGFPNADTDDCSGSRTIRLAVNAPGYTFGHAY